MSAGQPLRTQAAKVTELTITAVVLGLLLSVIMGAANVYLGLKAGMTVSASIPAAVIATGILQGVFRRRSILEANLVQTSASAGESLAAGIIFTMPALVIAGVWEGFQYWPTTLVALTGGLLGVLLMIPMRRVFVVENQELKYPEGLACAEVLWAGQATADEGDTGSAEAGVKLVAWGIAVGAIVKFAEKFLGLFRSTVEWGLYQRNHVFFFGLDISPALLAVGYIVGLSIAVQIFLGGAIGWLIAIPLMEVSETTTPAVETAYGLWSEQIRYMGVGAMIVGGVVSIWRVRGGLRAAAADVFTGMQRRRTEPVEVPYTERNLSAGLIIAVAIASVTVVGALYYYLLAGDVGITILTVLVMLVMSFFFSAVASYIVGLVGNSNSPVSGMTITVVLATGALVVLFGYTGNQGILAMLGVAGVVCCVACTSGDVCNDLKTGHLVGASPRLQQIMQLLGVFVAAFILTPVMVVLHEGSLRSGTGGIGGSELPAPQAGLFAALANGFFGDESLPWDMVGWGVGIGLALLAVDAALQVRHSKFRLHVMPVAVGIYLPLGLSVPILLGGFTSWLVARRNQASAEDSLRKGVLLTSGIIAGESLIGVLLGLFAYLGFATIAELLVYLEMPATTGYDWLADLARLSGGLRAALFDILSLAVLFAVAAWVYGRSRRGRSAV